MKYVDFEDIISLDRMKNYLVACNNKQISKNISNLWKFQK